jgi:hypothetical protein
MRNRRQHKKLEREEFWGDLWMLVLFVLFHPIAAFKKIRRETML